MHSLPAANNLLNAGLLMWDACFRLHWNGASQEFPNEFPHGNQIVVTFQSFHGTFV